MKRCGYCGSDNQDETTRCRQCGTDLVPTNPPIDSLSEGSETASDALVELQRCRDAESLKQITHILEVAGITYERSTLPPIFDLAKIGGGDDTEVIVSVARNLYPRARAAMESAYLKMDLPQNHYLLTSSDEELVEIVGQPSEWSAFDVAHARRLIGERGIDLTKVEATKAEHLRQLRRGRPAPKQLIFFGWIFSILGGLIGLGIAWSLSYTMEKTPDGEFFTYDEESRAVGRKMLAVALAVLAGVIVLRFSMALSR